MLALPLAHDGERDGDDGGRKKDALDVEEPEEATVSQRAEP